MTYLLLFIEFFKIGFFAIGGLASLPFIFDLVEKYHWFTGAELANMIAVSQSTPGPFAVNIATFAGYQTAGISGALVAVIALILPSLTISLLIIKFLINWRNNKYVEMAFRGLRPTTVGLITAISINLTLLAVCSSEYINFDAAIAIKPLIFLFILTPAAIYWQKNPLFFVTIGALAGIIFKF